MSDTTKEYALSFEAEEIDAILQKAARPETVINEASTYDQIPSAKAVMDALRNIKVTPASAEVRLLVGSWINNTQTVTAAEVKGSSAVIVTPSPDGVEVYSESLVRCTAQADGSLTFSCKTVPIRNLTVNVLIF